MSKSLGNVIEPFEVVRALRRRRAALLRVREVRFGQDGEVSPEGFEQRYTSELANEYGNLASRTLAMIERYRDGVVPEAEPPADLAAEFEGLREAVCGAHRRGRADAGARRDLAPRQAPEPLRPGRGAVEARQGRRARPTSSTRCSTGSPRGCASCRCCCTRSCRSRPSGCSPRSGARTARSTTRALGAVGRRRAARRARPALPARRGARDLRGLSERRDRHPLPPRLLQAGRRRAGRPRARGRASRGSRPSGMDGADDRARARGGARAFDGGVGDRRPPPAQRRRASGPTTSRRSSAPPPRPASSRSARPGLDYYRDYAPRDDQRRAFEAQLDLAARLGLPVAIHTRAAEDDTFAILARARRRDPDRDPALLLGARPARRGRRARLRLLVRRQRHVPEGRPTSRRRRASCRPTAAGRDRLAVPRAAAGARQAERAGQRRPHRAIRRRAARRLLRRARAHRRGQRRARPRAGEPACAAPGEHAAPARVRRPPEPRARPELPDRRQHPRRHRPRRRAGRRRRRARGRRRARRAVRVPRAARRRTCTSSRSTARSRAPLEDALAPFDNTTLHFADAVKLDLGALDPAPTKVVANLPYGVAATVLLQLDRGAARRRPSGSRWSSARSPSGSPPRPAGASTARPRCSPSSPATCASCAACPRTVFHPAPNVESALIVMRRHRPAPAPEVAALVHAAFAHRRKALAGSLALVPGAPDDIRAATRAALERIGQPADARAERARRPPTGPASPTRSAASASRRLRPAMTGGADDLGDRPTRARDDRPRSYADTAPSASSPTRRSTSSSTSAVRAPTGCTRSARCSRRSTSPTRSTSARPTRRGPLPRRRRAQPRARGARGLPRARAAAAARGRDRASASRSPPASAAAAPTPPPSCAPPTRSPARRSTPTTCASSAPASAPTSRARSSPATRSCRAWASRSSRSSLPPLARVLVPCADGLSTRAVYAELDRRGDGARRRSTRSRCASSRPTPQRSSPRSRTTSSRRRSRCGPSSRTRSPPCARPARSAPRSAAPARPASASSRPRADAEPPPPRSRGALAVSLRGR